MTTLKMLKVESIRTPVVEDCQLCHLERQIHVIPISTATKIHNILMKILKIKIITKHPCVGLRSSQEASSSHPNHGG